jgi:hypothetical protein
VSSSGPDGKPGTSDDIWPSAPTNSASPTWPVSTSVLNQALSAGEDVPQNGIRASGITNAEGANPMN